MFIPNNSGELSLAVGFNVNGEPLFSIPARVPCAVVRLDAGIGKTSVRADSSASRSNAEEVVVKSKILFPAHITISKGAHFSIAGMELRVVEIEPRYSVLGQLDHFEVDLDHWGD